MDDDDRGIERMLRRRYGAQMNIDPGLIDRMTIRATAQPQGVAANDAWIAARRAAVMACLLLSVLAGTFTGFQGSSRSLTVTREDAVYREAEKILFAQNLNGFGG